MSRISKPQSETARLVRDKPFGAEWYATWGIGKGGDNVNYVVSPRNAYDDNRQFVREHVIVAEKMLGRRLCNGEVVHHIDQNKSNNSPSNLMVFASNADHSAFHKGARIYKKDGIWHADYDKKIYKCAFCGKTFSTNYKRQNKETFCSKFCANKAKEKVSNLSKDALFCLIIQHHGNISAVGKELGVSDNAIRKHCKRHGIPYHSMFYRNLLNGALAHSEEHRICNPKVEGA